MTAGSLALIALGLVVLMASSALFSAIETALFRCSRITSNG
jgi:Mg2+/Co2+ transporter CorB